MPNSLRKIFLGLILLVCVFFISFNQSIKNAQKLQQEVTNQITVGNKDFKVLLADTPELRQKGLSGRATMDANEVMVFVFERSARNFFWMKDMLFPIDIVWLDAEKKVVHIESAVKPESYPKSFGPDADSKYVLEFKEGVVESIGLKVGDIVSF